MYAIEYTTRFRRSFKKCIKRGLDAAVFEQVIRLLQESGKLPPEYRPTNYRADTLVIGNAICNQIGCWYGCKTTTDSYCNL